MKTCLQILDVSYLPTNQLLFACRPWYAPSREYLARGSTIAQHINVCTLCMQYTYRAYYSLQSILIYTNTYIRYIYTIYSYSYSLIDFCTFAVAVYCLDILYTSYILSKLNFCIHIAYRFCSYHVCVAYADHIYKIYIHIYI